MSKKIFISYRRDDARYQARSVFSALNQVVDRENIFMDVDTIPPGSDFVETLRSWVEQCDVLLALIGPDWLDMRDASGQRRLDKPDDFVRIEIETALRRNIPLVPILLDGAEMPRPETLPAEIRDLSRRNAERARYETFEDDVERLARRLGLGEAGDGARRGGANRSRSSAPILIGVGAAALAAAAAAVLIDWRPDGAPNTAADIQTASIQNAATPSSAGAGDAEASASRGDFALNTAVSPVADGETLRDCAACPEMVAVPAGAFDMGSPPDEALRKDDEGPVHTVTVARFALARTETTFDQWDACVADGYCRAIDDDRDWGRGRQPVINVSWTDITGDGAQEPGFLAWLNSKVEGEPYRLPSEAEWEYAARAGSTLAFGTGAIITGDQANFNAARTYNDSPQGLYRRRPIVVGSFPQNAFGLQDMHGNVAEWVADCWNGSYIGAPTDGSAWMNGNCTSAVVRGGAFNKVPSYVRAAARDGERRTRVTRSLGFRVARSL